MDDLLIRGGHVLDGTGGPGREADVAVRDGRIAAIEPHSSRPARRTISAQGQVVAPGFIDIHTHSDFTLPLNPRAESKVRQGVTTEVVGNCGFSVAPALPGRADVLREYLASSAPWLSFHESTFAQYVAGVSADLRQRDSPGRASHPAPDDCGHGQPSADGCRARGHGAAAGGGAEGRRVGALDRALHRARRIRRRRRDPWSRASAGPAPRGVRVTYPRRGRSCLRGGPRGHRGGGGDGRARADRPPQALRHQQLGRGDAPPHGDRDGAASGPSRGRRRLSRTTRPPTLSAISCRDGSWRAASPPCSSGSAVATSARACATTSRGMGSPTSAASRRGTWCAWPWRRIFPSTRAAPSATSRAAAP